MFGVAPFYGADRFPNVVVCTDGSILATWGRSAFKVRRSEDGGVSWSPVATVADPGFHGGGVVVDETNGDVLAFIEDKHPPASLHVYRSTDHGSHWEKQEFVVHPDANGNVPSMHMSEHGITLKFGPKAGRLLRPARVYDRPKGYNTAIYSDDGGRTWRASAPFPIIGTGEGAVAELSDGRIYYSSRRHWFEDENELRHERLYSWSDDGGETWAKSEYSSVLPDGPRYRGKERRGANFNGHFGMMSGLVRLPVKDRDILLYSNADTDGHERVRMTVWASLDGGKTWPVKRLVYEGPSAYSSLAAGRAGTSSEGMVFLFFEGGADGPDSGLQMACFNLAWVMEGERTGDGANAERNLPDLGLIMYDDADRSFSGPNPGEAVENFAILSTRSRERR